MSQFDMISVKKKKKRYLLCYVLFLYFEQTVVQIKNTIILILNTNTIITLLYYVYNLFCFHCECTQIKANLYPVIINKTRSKFHLETKVLEEGWRSS